MTGPTVEQRDQQRRNALVAFLIAFCLWQVPLLLGEWVSVPGPLRGGLAVAAAGGGLVWAWMMLRLYRLQRAIAGDPAVAAALDDERVREVRLRSFTVGFVAIVVYLVLLRVSTALPTAAVPVGVAAQLGILVAVVAPTTAFLFYDREDA